MTTPADGVTSESVGQLSAPSPLKSPLESNHDGAPLPEPLSPMFFQPSPLIPLPVAAPKKVMRVVYLTTCHGTALTKIFARHPVLKDWKHDVYQNFKYIEAGEKYPLDEMVGCDIFIYQPIEEKGRPGYGTDGVIEYITKAQGFKPILISFFYLYFLGYTPDHSGNGHDDLPYLSRRVIELSHRTVQLTETYGWGKDDDKNAKIPSQYFLGADQIEKRATLSSFIPTPYIEKRLQYCFEVIKGKEEACSVKVLDFIKKNWQTTCLFHTTNHPTNVLLQVISDEVIAQIASGTGIPLEKIDISDMEEILHDFVTPILPCVMKVNGIKFKPAPIRIKCKEVTLRQYIDEVIRVFRAKDVMGE